MTSKVSNNASNLLKEGIKLLALDEDEKALRCFNKIEELERDTICLMKVLFHKGIALYKLGVSESKEKRQEALEYFNKALELEKYNKDDIIKVESLYNKSIILYEFKKYDEVQYCLHILKMLNLKNIKTSLSYDDVDKFEKDLIPVLMDKGIEDGNKGNHEEALKFFNMVLDIDNKNIYALYHKGLASYYLNNNEIALSTFNKILDMNIDNIAILYTIGQAFYRLGKDDKAFQCLKKNVGDIRLMFFKALILGNLNVHQAKEKSNECFEKIATMDINKDNRDDYMYKSLANILKQPKDFEKAYEVYWESIKNWDMIKTDENEESFSYHNSFSPFLNELLQEKEDVDIYHYTGIGGLKGILENKEFWVTRADFLNDPTETRYICEIIDKIKEQDFKDDIKSIIENIRDDLDIFYGNKKLNKANKRINEYIKNNISSSKKDIYILSMTSEEDSLPMWLNYSKSDGYNIKFDKNNLIKIFRSNSFCPNLHGEVQYIGKEKDENIIVLLNLINQIYESGKKNKIENKYIEYAILSNLTMIALFIKHPGFEYEKEYRFTFMPKYWGNMMQSNYDIISKIKNFRIGSNNNLTPYIKVPIDVDEKLIEQITISPTSNYELAKNGLKDFVEFKNIKISDDKILKSKIPYRKV